MPNPSSAASSGNVIRRAGKVALGLAVLGALGWVPLRAIFATTSVEALVNARVETFRSPIEGIVVGTPDGAQYWRSGTLTNVRIVDPLADRTRLDDLRRERQTLESEVSALEGQSEVAKAKLTTLDAQIEKFRNGRLKLLDARLSSQASAYEAAVAKASQAAADKRRTDELIKSGSTTAAESDRRLYEWLAASATEAADKKRLAETKVERDAIANGVFVGDHYNDKPESEQQATELRLKAGEIDAQTKSGRSPSQAPRRTDCPRGSPLPKARGGGCRSPVARTGLGSADLRRRAGWQGSGSHSGARLLASHRHRKR